MGVFRKCGPASFKEIDIRETSQWILNQNRVLKVLELLLMLCSVSLRQTKRSVVSAFKLYKANNIWVVLILFNYVAFLPSKFFSNILINALNTRLWVEIAY